HPISVMTAHEIHIRELHKKDIPSIAAILEQSPEAARWNAADCLHYTSFVAEADGKVAGFLSARSIAGESEILNLAVDVAFRRRGVARRLIGHFFLFSADICFLEVREGNQAAIQLYESMGFVKIS